jgi:Ca2+-transporting ATPase
MKSHTSYKGLDNALVIQMRQLHGWNEWDDAQIRSSRQIFKEIVLQPMFLLLIACGVLYMLIGDFTEGLILFGTNLIIIGISFFQQKKAENALASLKQLQAPKALVVRNGEANVIPAREIVPGDICLLEAGDRIPADGNVLDARDAETDESLLTGESMTVQKSTQANQQFLLAGTMLYKGSVSMKVTATGKQCAIGQIGSSLQNIKISETPLQQNTRKLINRMAALGILLSILVAVLFFLRRGELVPAILSGLSSAMAIIPEEFPVVFTVFLALGSWKLSQHNLLVRQPAAIEALGATTVLCCDKTGTLTKNSMTVSEIQSISTYAKSNPELLPLISRLSAQPKSKDPIEKAIESSFLLKDIDVSTYKPEQTIGFSHSRMMTINVWSRPNDMEKIVCVKGAPENIFNISNLDTEQIKVATDAYHKHASDGKRVLAVATCKIPSNVSIENIAPQDLTLTFLGFITFLDPLRDDVGNALETCKRAGIRIMLLTGDLPETATFIGSQIGLSAKHLMTGMEIDKLGDNELRTALRNSSILARVKPAQKLRIVEALKEDGEIVAMTGDGVNDAPALKASHIGVAMGNKGTDVARESSAIVLLDDNFASIVKGIEMGRQIFDNLRRAFVYIATIHIPIVGLSILPILDIRSPILLLPLHIVFLELIIDPISSIAFESQPPGDQAMQRPPRNINDGILNTRQLMFSAAYGTVLLGAVLFVFFMSKAHHFGPDEIRTVSFATLMICNLLLVFILLTMHDRFIRDRRYINRSAIGIIVIAITGLCMILFLPFLRNIFSFEPLTMSQVIYIFLGVVLFALSMVLLRLIQLKIDKSSLAHSISGKPSSPDGDSVLPRR